MLARFLLRALGRGMEMAPPGMAAGAGMPPGTAAGAEAALEDAKRQMSRDIVARLLDRQATADALQFKIWAADATDEQQISG